MDMSCGKVIKVGVSIVLRLFVGSGQVSIDSLKVKVKRWAGCVSQDDRMAPSGEEDLAGSDTTEAVKFGNPQPHWYLLSG